MSYRNWSHMLNMQIMIDEQHFIPLARTEPSQLIFFFNEASFFCFVFLFCFLLCFCSFVVIFLF